MWDRKELKSRGKAAFKANYWKSVLVAFLLIAFVIGTGSSSGRAAGSKLDEQNLSFTAENGVYEVNGQSYDNLQDAVTALGEAADANPEDIQEVNNLIEQVQNDPETAKALMMAAALIGGALLFIVLICGLLRILVINPLEVGCRSFFVRNAEAPAALGELGRGFSPYGRSVGTMFLRGLFQFLWSLLFVIPGIIKHYSYRMVPYILADQPELSCSTSTPTRLPPMPSSTMSSRPCSNPVHAKNLRRARKGAPHFTRFPIRCPKARCRRAGRRRSRGQGRAWPGPCRAVRPPGRSCSGSRGSPGT